MTLRQSIVSRRLAAGFLRGMVPWKAEMERNMSTIEKAALMIAMVASQAHEDWRREHKATKGDAPRVKPTKDTAWSEAHGGATTVDIANTEYNGLPEDWKGENKANAEVAVAGVVEMIEAIAADVHDKWVKRNAWAPTEQKVAYMDLPESEKEKDRVVVRRAMEALLKNN